MTDPQTMRHPTDAPNTPEPNAPQRPLDLRPQISHNDLDKLERMLIPLLRHVWKVQGKRRRIVEGD